MNDLVREIIETDDRLVIAAVLGNAGAGGVFLSLAADEIWMREGVILNRTIRTWAISTARNTGPICCRLGLARTEPAA
ncbi:hypothetical protein [Mesorhizobium shangrilense]|uniref:Uncharacterized protein n=1 Tax=Mesorhizobium shangrilense TaxID=460060 RepID=A0ABV2DR95_9HYPH